MTTKTNNGKTEHRRLEAQQLRAIVGGDDHEKLLPAMLSWASAGKL